MSINQNAAKWNPTYPVNSYFTRKSLDRLNNNLVSFKTQESIKHFFSGSHPPETQKHLKLLSSLLLQDAAVIEW